MEIAEEKAELRTKMREVRKSIDARTRERAARNLVQRLINLPAVKHARCIGAYKAYGSELSVDPAIDALRASDAARIIAYPVLIKESTMMFVKFGPTDDTTVLQNPTTIVTNIPPERGLNPTDLDLILVPGLAFDEQGHRLGQGRGCYDRMLPHTEREAITIGIAFDEQIADTIPCSSHDKRVDYILTPSRLITV